MAPNVVAGDRRHISASRGLSVRRLTAAAVLAAGAGAAATAGAVAATAPHQTAAPAAAVASPSRAILAPARLMTSGVHLAAAESPATPVAPRSTATSASRQVLATPASVSSTTQRVTMTPWQEHTMWYVTRATGEVGVVLLSASAVIGLLSRGGVETERWPRVLSQKLHRNVSLAALSCLGLHVGLAVTDPFTHLGLTAAAVPFTSWYKPFGVGLGVISGDLLLASILTSMKRQAIGLRAWKAIHYLNYVMLPVAMAHCFFTGTDGHKPLVLWTNLGCLGAVGATAAWRFTGGRKPPAERARAL